MLNYEVSCSLYEETDKFKLAGYGTEGTGLLNSLKAYKNIASSTVDLTTQTSAQSKNHFKKSYENELKHFIEVVQGTSPPILSSEEASERMKLV